MAKKLKAKKLKAKNSRGLTRDLVPKNPATESMLNVKELRELRETVGILHKFITKLIQQNANVHKELADMRREMFLNDLASGMKNKKSLKKKAQSKKYRLLEKCGVGTRKATLTEKDVERIKSRVPMVD